MTNSIEHFTQAEADFAARSTVVYDAYFCYQPTDELMQDSLTSSQFEKLQKLSPAVQAGLGQMFRYIYTKFVICEVFPTSQDKRLFEQSLRDRMNSLDLTKDGAAEYWHELHLLHHTSVTADQADLSRAAFI